MHDFRPSEAAIGRCTKEIRQYIVTLEQQLQERDKKIAQLSDTETPSNTRVNGWDTYPDHNLEPGSQVMFWPRHKESESGFEKYRRCIAVRVEDDHVCITGHPALRMVPSSINTIDLYPARPRD